MPVRHIIFALCLVFAAAGCESFPGDEELGTGFYTNFLQDNQTGVPINAELQVYLGDALTPDELTGISASLTDSGGFPVSGATSVDTDHWIVVFKPAAALAVLSSYTLTLQTAGGKTFVYNFTTGAGPGIPPEVSIVQPASGETVNGVILVGASVGDDIGLSMVESLFDGFVTGFRTGPPYYFYINTTTVPDGGPYTIEIKATDIEGIQSSDTVAVYVQNGATTRPFRVYNEGLDPDDGMTALSTALPLGVMIEAFVFTDADYGTWSQTLKVGDLQMAGYNPGAGFNAEGVPCLKISNFTMMPPLDPYSFPASTLQIVMPDRSSLTVYLPTVNIPWSFDKAYYVAADGSTYDFYDAGGSPLSPSAALSNPPAAP